MSDDGLRRKNFEVQFAYSTIKEIIEIINIIDAFK